MKILTTVIYLSMHESVILNIVLFFASAPFITLAISFGYLNINPELYKKMQFQVFIAMIFNVWLKSFFLAPPLPDHTGWSFPSGHSHVFAVILYNLFLFYSKYTIRICLLSALIIMPIAIIQAGHHFLDDVIAGYCYAGLTVWLFKIVDNLSYKFSENLKIFLFTMLILINFLTNGPVIIYPIVIAFAIFSLSTTIAPVSTYNLQLMDTASKIRMNIACISSLAIAYSLLLYTNNFVCLILTYPTCVLIATYLIPKYYIFNSRAGYVNNII